MTKTVKIILISALSLVMIALVFYCVQFGKTPAEKSAENPTVSTEDALQTAERLSAAAETAWRNGTANHITLSDSGSISAAAGVQITGKTVTITLPGIYIINGTLTEGRIAVYCVDTVVLILDNAEIRNSTDAAICVYDAGHTLIYLPEGSTNKLVSGTERIITAASENADVDSASGATLYARDSLSIAGSGKLTVAGYINNAVTTTDRLVILGGEIEITAVNNGLKGKDSFTVIDGRITVHSGNDGIKSDNDVDADCGNIDIRGGEINIVSFGDGMQAEKNLTVENGTVTVVAGDTSENNSDEPRKPYIQPSENGSNPDMGEMSPDLPNDGEPGTFPDNRENGMFPPGGETPPDKPNGDIPQNPQQPRPGQEKGNDELRNPSGDKREDLPENFDNDRDKKSDSAASAKGLKCGNNLTVSGGSITVNSVDDCIHANGSITVTGGTFRLSTGDDGFHADDTLTVSDGDITVLQSYEGLEGHLIYLSGGNISVMASDDGINANGGTSAMFGRMFGQTNNDGSSVPVLKISGGTLYINADGDGLDSNGNLIVEGGNIIVDGPTDGGNGALDSGAENGGSIVCNGGTILAVGASGMAETFGDKSTQCSFIKNFSGTMQAGTKITVSDENGKTIFEHTAAKSFNSVVFSSPEITIGKTYTLSVGNQSEKISVESISNGASSGFGPHGDFGGRERK